MPIFNYIIVILLAAVSISFEPQDFLIKNVLQKPKEKKKREKERQRGEEACWVDEVSK